MGAPDFALSDTPLATYLYLLLQIVVIILICKFGRHFGPHDPPHHSRSFFCTAGCPRYGRIYADRELVIVGFALHDGDHFIHDRIW